MGITAKQKRFAQEYIIDLNATQAAIRAGYAPKTAGRNADRLVKNPTIQAAIAEAMEQRAKRTEVTADRVLRELAYVAFANQADYGTWDNDDVILFASKTLGPDKTAAVRSVKKVTTTTPLGKGQEKVQTKVEIGLHDKLKALELIARHLGMFSEGSSAEREVIVKVERSVPPNWNESAE